MVSILTDPVQATEPLFQRLSAYTSAPADQLRCVALIALGYPLGAVYHYGFHPDYTSLVVRHTVSTSIGVIFGLMSFGWLQMAVLFSVTGVCYAMLLIVPTKVVHVYTILFAMGSMSAAHIYRMFTDYGGWHLDFTGPLMVIVQRVTLTAFTLHDGVARKEAELNDDQKQMKLKEVPSLLEYWSYNYNFHTFLAGPACTMKEYLNFVDGSNFRATPIQNGDGKIKAKPQPLYPVISTLLGALLFLTIHLLLGTQYPLDDILVPNHSLFTRILIVHITFLHVRARYYFIWLLVESVNDYVGLGFSGYDKEGKPVWNVCKNIRVLDVEFATNAKQLSTGWNVTSSLWLRRVCYERVPSTFVISPNMTVWILSAIWHGFYPGYYLTFLCLGFVNEAARKMRRILHHRFQTSRAKKVLYNVVTMVTTIFFMDFGVPCFNLLFLDKGLKFWSYFYYVPLVVVVVVSFLPASRERKGSSKTSNREE